MGLARQLVLKEAAHMSIIKKLIALVLLLFLFNIFFKTPISVANAPKILHIASYHQEFSWTNHINQGIQTGLKNTPHEYKVFYMDTKRKSSSEDIEAAAKKAKRIIKEWKPDIVITSDDNATSHIAAKYDPKSNIKYVFTGVNNEPSSYNAPNSHVTGVLERIRARDSVAFLNLLKKDSHNIVILTDNSPSSLLISHQLEEDLLKEKVNILASYSTNSFENWKEVVNKYQSGADAFFVILYHTLKDGKGNHVPYKIAMKWTTSNSKIPEIGFWPFVANGGGLGSVSVEPFEQGYQAARIAKKILNGADPAKIKPRPTLKRKMYVNAQRAKDLNIVISDKLKPVATIIK